MKRIISILLLLSLTFSFFACTPHRSDEVSCEEIIAAYEDAGYTMGHHLHEDPVYLQEGISCSLMFEDPEDPDQNYIYIHRHSSLESAKEATKKNKHNIVIWFVFGLSGEWRWLKSERFGKLHCTTFDRKMITPLRETVQ